MKKFEIYVNCEDVVEIKVKKNSVVELFWDGGCRGEYWGSEGDCWEGIEEIEEGVERVNDMMEMGEDGVWWIKVDGKLVYGSEEDWKEWKEDRERDWEDFRDGNEEGEEDVMECRGLLDGLNEENWLDLDYVGEISMLLSCF